MQTRRYFSINDVGTLGHPHAKTKNESQPKPHTMHQKLLKWSICLKDGIITLKKNFLWSLYSDDWWSEKTAGLNPNRLSYISFQSFYNREQSAVRGFEIQGKLDLKKPVAFLPWAVSCPGQAAAAAVPSLPGIQRLGCLQLCPRRSALSQEWGLPAVPETIALTYALPTGLLNYLLKFSNSWVPYHSPTVSFKISYFYTIS